MQNKLDRKLSTLEFLWSSARKLQNESRDDRNLGVVLAQMRESCLKLARNEGVDSTSVFQQKDVCRYCGNPWSNGSYKLRVLNHDQKMRKLKNKLHSSTGDISDYHKNLLLLFSKRKDNVMEKQCTICKKKIKIGLTKPSAIKAVEEEKETNVTSIPENKKRKKKSKKDRFSGLFPSAVVGARLSQSFRHSLSQIGSNSSLIGTNSSDIETDSVACSNMEITCDESPLHSTDKCIKKLKHFHNANSSSLSNSCFTNDNLVTESDVTLNTSTDTKKKKHKTSKKNKNKNLAMTNSYISFNDDSVLNMSDSKIGPFSPQLKKNLNKLNRSSLDSSNSSINKQEINKKIHNKSQKKKKKSAVSEFLKFL